MQDNQRLYHFEELKSETGKKELRWKVPQNLPCFEGHFPGNPILPAVAIIDATVAALKTHFGVTGTLKRIPNAKFLGMVKPGDQIALKFNPDKDGRWTVEWNQILDDGTTQKKSELSVELTG